jgi:hypothetical protein
MAFPRGFLFEATFAKIIEAGLSRWQCSRPKHIVRYQGMNGPSFDAALGPSLTPSRKWLFSPSSLSGQLITALRNVFRSGSFAPDRT